MGLFDDLFGEGSSNHKNGKIPDYLRKYDGIDYGEDGNERRMPNDGIQMYCTRCRTICRGGLRCRECGNELVVWK